MAKVASCSQGPITAEAVEHGSAAEVRVVLEPLLMLLWGWVVHCGSNHCRVRLLELHGRLRRSLQDSQLKTCHVLSMPAGKLKTQQRLLGRATMRPSSSARWLRQRTRASSSWSSSTCPVSGSSCRHALWATHLVAMVFTVASLVLPYQLVAIAAPYITAMDAALQFDLSSRCCTCPACNSPWPLLLLLRRLCLQS